MQWKIGGSGLAAILIAAALGLPLGEWVKPVLYMVMICGVLAVIFRATSLAAGCLSLSLVLISFQWGYAWLSNTLQRALSTREVVFALGGLALGAVLLGFSKLGSLFRRKDRPMRPTRTRRAALQEPEDDAPWDAPEDDREQDEDEVDVFRWRRGQGRGRD